LKQWQKGIFTVETKAQMIGSSCTYFCHSKYKIPSRPPSKTTIDILGRLVAYQSDAKLLFPSFSKNHQITSFLAVLAKYGSRKIK
jgi:hypothetical protein